MIADVLDAESTISVLFLRRALAILPWTASSTNISCLFDVPGALEITEATQETIDSGAVGFARGHTQPKLVCKLRLPWIRAFLRWYGVGWTDGRHERAPQRCKTNERNG